MTKIRRIPSREIWNADTIIEISLPWLHELHPHGVLTQLHRTQGWWSWFSCWMLDLMSWRGWRWIIRPPIHIYMLCQWLKDSRWASGREGLTQQERWQALPTLPGSWVPRCGQCDLVTKSQTFEYNSVKISSYTNLREYIRFIFITYDTTNNWGRWTSDVIFRKIRWVPLRSS